MHQCPSPIQPTRKGPCSPPEQHRAPLLPAEQSIHQHTRVAPRSAAGVGWGRRHGLHCTFLCLWKWHPPLPGGEHTPHHRHHQPVSATSRAPGTDSGWDAKTTGMGQRGECVWHGIARRAGQAPAPTVVSAGVCVCLCLCVCVCPGRHTGLRSTGTPCSCAILTAAWCQGAHHLLLPWLGEECHRLQAHCFALLHEQFMGAASEQAAAKCWRLSPGWAAAWPGTGTRAPASEPSRWSRVAWGPARVAEQPSCQRVPTEAGAALFPNCPGASLGCGNRRSRGQPRMPSMRTRHSPRCSQLTSLDPILILQSQWPGMGSECPWGWKQCRTGDSS